MSWRWFGLLFLLTTTCAEETPQSPVKVLLISFDGFRWDYLDLAKAAGYNTTNFDSLIEDGCTVAPGGVMNIFPTKTFPNHYAMVTGLHASRHGLVHNSFYDPEYGPFEFNDTFQDPLLKPQWWNNGTRGQSPMPLWIANQMGQSDLKAPSARRSGVMMWPGGGVKLYEQESFKWRLLNNSVSNESRIDEIISWYLVEETPINLGLLYFNEPDHFGHEVGPTSPELMKLISDLDDLVGYLIKKLKDSGLFDVMNLIITSDHGMATIQERIHLADHVDLSSFDVYGSSPVILVWPHEGMEESIYANLSSVPNMNIYRKTEIPSEYKYTYNVRIPPLLLVAEPNYTFCLENCSSIMGNHGYNNSWTDMHPFFVARGPAFWHNHTSPTFDNLDIYSLICEILGVEAGPHDGNLTNVENMLRKIRPKSQSYVIWLVCFAIGLPVVVISLIFTIRACRTRVLRYERVDRLADGLMTVPGEEEDDVLLSSDEFS